MTTVEERVSYGITTFIMTRDRRWGTDEDVQPNQAKPVGPKSWSPAERTGPWLPDHKTRLLFNY